MPSWLFLDRLLPSVTAKELNELFASHGTVERVLLFKNSSGQHVAFIKMADADARKAAQAVNEGSLLGEQGRAVLLHSVMPADSKRT